MTFLRNVTFKIIFFINFFIFSMEGIAKIAAIAGCGALCAVNVVTPEAMELCKDCMNGALSLSCFSKTAKFYLPNNLTLTASEIKIGDSLLTLNEEGSFKFSKVIFKKKSSGKFNFVSIILKNGKSIKVTDEHGIIFLKNKKKYLKSADQVNIGDIIITTQGNSIVEKIEKFTDNDKFTIETEEGSVFSNEILVSTLCHEEINKKEYKDIIEDWKSAHIPFLKRLGYLK